MFSGIVCAVGEVTELIQQPAGSRLSIQPSVPLPYSPQLGSSIAINGACLTICQIEGEKLSFDISPETLQCTLIGSWSVGTKVNIEPALRMGDELGGHMVTGHIDGVGKIIQRTKQGHNTLLVVSAPATIMELVAAKGSITMDGVSLTTNHADDSRFSVMIVPWTLANTIITDYQEGHEVHLEVDIIARYVTRLLKFNKGL